MTALSMPSLTLTEFLTWENEQPERHEFHRGEVFAMVGGRRVHGRVVSNLVRRSSEALDGSPCQVFHEGMKVEVADDKSSTPMSSSPATRPTSPPTCCSVRPRW